MAVCPYCGGDDSLCDHPVGYSKVTPFVDLSKNDSNDNNEEPSLFAKIIGIIILLILLSVLFSLFR